MQLTEALLDLCKTSPAFIAIDGPAGAGKTTLASGLAQAFAPKSVLVIHMDDLYSGWDDPFSKDWQERIHQIARAQQAGHPIETTYFDWITQTYSRPTLIKPASIIILEGVGSGSEDFAEFLNALIWIDIDPKIGLNRVLERDGNDIHEQMKKWLLQQSQHFGAHRSYERADFVLTT